MAAKSEGKTAILERGSTHCCWNIRKVTAVYNKLGFPLDEIADEQQILYDLKEYETADIICVPSKFVYQTFIENGVPADKLYINPYGVDYSFWSQCETHSTAPGPFTFLWVATLMPRKGIAVLLEAWKKADMKNARLVLVGGVATSVIPLIKTLPRGVELKSFLDHKAVRTEMARSQAYILPSFEEGMARSVLEAAAAGLPVIITKETGATDILKNNRDGWVVPSGDVATLADTMKQIASDPTEARKRGAAAQAAVKPFTWDAYGARAAKLLTGRSV